jgi:hypothetical protein
MSTPISENFLNCTAKCFDGFSENFSLLFLFSNIIIIYKKKKNAKIKLKINFGFKKIVF